MADKRKKDRKKNTATNIKNDLCVVLREAKKKLWQQVEKDTGQAVQLPRSFLSVVNKMKNIADQHHENDLYFLVDHLFHHCFIDNLSLNELYYRRCQHNLDVDIILIKKLLLYCDVLLTIFEQDHPSSQQYHTQYRYITYNTIQDSLKFISHRVVNIDLYTARDAVGIMLKALYDDSGNFECDISQCNEIIAHIKTCHTTSLAAYLAGHLKILHEKIPEITDNSVSVFINNKLSTLIYYVDIYCVLNYDQVDFASKLYNQYSSLIEENMKNIDVKILSKDSIILEPIIEKITAIENIHIEIVNEIKKEICDMFKLLLLINSVKSVFIDQIKQCSDDLIKVSHTIALLEEHIVEPINREINNTIITIKDYLIKIKSSCFYQYIYCLDNPYEVLNKFLNNIRKNISNHSELIKLSIMEELQEYSYLFLHVIDSLYSNKRSNYPYSKKCQSMQEKCHHLLSSLHYFLRKHTVCCDEGIDENSNVYSKASQAIGIYLLMIHFMHVVRYLKERESNDMSSESDDMSRKKIDELVNKEMKEIFNINMQLYQCSKKEKITQLIDQDIQIVKKLSECWDHIMVISHQAERQSTQKELNMVLTEYVADSKEKIYQALCRCQLVNAEDVPARQTYLLFAASIKKRFITKEQHALSQLSKHIAQLEPSKLKQVVTSYGAAKQLLDIVYDSPVSTAPRFYIAGLNKELNKEMSADVVNAKRAKISSVQNSMIFTVSYRQTQPDEVVLSCSSSYA